MKKIVLCLLFSALIGALLGVYSFRLYNKDERVSSTYNSVYAIQIGVFDEVNNANKLASKYGAVVVSENNRYRVYVAIVNDTLSLVEKYYDDLKIPYYVRNINVSNNFYNKLLEYEVSLKNSDQSEYESIINQILKMYMEDLWVC